MVAGGHSAAFAYPIIACTVSSGCCGNFTGDMQNQVISPFTVSSTSISCLPNLSSATLRDKMVWKQGTSW
ncbi:MAG: hypothetical protein U0T81_00475 [Saprospiraceae bacterium]